MIHILLSGILGEYRISQAELARATGIRPNTISEIYNEFCTNIQLKHLNLLCEALDCRVEDLLVYTPNSIPSIRHSLFMHKRFRCTSAASSKNTGSDRRR